MATRRFAAGLAVLTIICTVMLSVCPATFGPFQATHGPTVPKPSGALQLLLFVLGTMAMAAEMLSSWLGSGATWRADLAYTVCTPGRLTPAAAHLRC